MFGNADKPLRVKDLAKLLLKQNPDAYICLGDSISKIDGKNGKLANRFSGNHEEVYLYFENENNLIKD